MVPIIKKALLAVVILGSLATAYFWFQIPESSPTTQTIAQSSKVSPDIFTGTTVLGTPFSLKDHSGKALVINYSASWCGPCIMEVPHLNSIQNQYSDSVQVIGVSLDDDIKKMTRFIKKNRVTYPMFAYTREMISLPKSIASIPTTLIVNPDGDIIYDLIGYRPKSQLLEALSPFINP